MLERLWSKCSAHTPAPSEPDWFICPAFVSVSGTNTSPHHATQALRSEYAVRESRAAIGIAYKTDHPNHGLFPPRLSSTPYKRCNNAHRFTMTQNPNATAQAMAAAVEALLQGPGLEPPPGVMPNFINPPSVARWVYITLPICLAVSTPFVWIRLCTVFFILKSHGWADCMVTFALIALEVGKITDRE